MTSSCLPVTTLFRGSWSVKKKVPFSFFYVRIRSICICVNLRSSSSMWTKNKRMDKCKTVTKLYMHILADRALIDERDGASRKSLLRFWALGDVTELLCVVLRNSNAQKKKNNHMHAFQKIFQSQGIYFVFVFLSFFDWKLWEKFDTMLHRVPQSFIQ